MTVSTSGARGGETQLQQQNVAHAVGGLLQDTDQFLQEFLTQGFQGFQGVARGAGEGGDGGKPLKEVVKRNRLLVQRFGSPPPLSPCITSLQG